MENHNPLDSSGDPFGPPDLSTLVACLHCGQEYDSYRIEWRIETHADGKPHGFWCCPIAGCGGMGFGFDIFPIDPEYRDKNGELMWVSDDENEDADDDELYLEDATSLEAGDLEAGDLEAGDLEAGESRRSTTDDYDEPLPW